jgi:hypothetical protein
MPFARGGIDQQHRWIKERCMNWLVVWSTLFVVFLAATVCSAMFANGRSWLSSGPNKVCVSFVLTSLLAFILTNQVLEVPNPIFTTIAFVLAGAVMLELARVFILKQKAVFMNTALILFGLCLFLFSRFAMHKIGAMVVDQFETFID